ncbi:MAG: hypothetical protein Q4A37_02600 [Candidatus Saccharibacteria bacterium]|nr:hypothetical protein [Candidatus Saccharibacteria bacterium]
MEQQPPIQHANQPLQPMAQPPQQSTKGLEITGLILACIPLLTFGGLALSIIALIKTKALHGTPSTLSIIGVTLGSLMTLLTIIVLITSWHEIIDAANTEVSNITGVKRSDK